MILAGMISAALARPVALDRVDVLASDPGLWLHDELPRVARAPRFVAIRFLAQVQPVWQIPVRGLVVGTSLSSQSVRLERELWPSARLGADVGVHTQLLLPRGAMAGIWWRPGPVRLAVGASAVSGASWANPDWSRWRVLPTAALGVGVR